MSLSTYEKNGMMSENVFGLELGRAPFSSYEATDLPPGNSVALLALGELLGEGLISVDFFQINFTEEYMYTLIADEMWQHAKYLIWRSTAGSVHLLVRTQPTDDHLVPAYAKWW